MTTSKDVPNRPWPPLTTEQQQTLERYEQAHHRLDQGLIRPEQTAKTPERSMARWTARMQEMRSFLAACGDPHRASPVIHVTGTSGKGSVTTLIGAALHRAGYRVGVHTSPYLQTPTEKNWIAGELLGPELFADLVDWVWPVAAPRKTPENPASIHGMASVAMAFEAFRRAEVDVAVIEAGCGGRFDLTNVVEPLAAVITNVGPDHLLSLGPTVEDIAWHKAGVLKPGAAGVTGASGGPLEVIRREAREHRVELREVTTPVDRPFWEINARVARACLDLVRHRFDLPEAVIDEAIATARLPARRELAPEPGREVILDGAHNPDKMAALVRTVEPGSVFLAGCLSAKDASGLVSALAPKAAAVVTTEPMVYAKPPFPAEELATAFTDRGVEAQAVRSPLEALERALEVAAADQAVVVTGSLYLVGQIRAQWYPTERLVLQRTCWPEPG